ncbi:MAG: selenocysteine-specific translation elongation factor [Terriglobales bacterium]
MILATAGHVDHGKSALVEALTGVHPDRLAEERRRGMTLDLGFGHWLCNGSPVGVVDVPGHERFVRTMLAGAAGVDAVCLVVAADAGVQPQTREHLAICHMLGLCQGVVAISKCDLAAGERIAAVRAQLAALVAGTFLAGARVLEVSAKTGRGIAALRQALEEAASQAPARHAGTPVRLPVDRSFTLAGFGTVVTGTLLSGTVSVGDTLELAPAGARLRVRGLEAYGQPAAAVRAGQRVAVNLAAIAAGEIRRGMELLEPGVFAVTRELDVACEFLPGAAIPKHRSRVSVHLGAARAPATLLWLEAPRYAQLRLASPVVAAPGDRCILRQLSPALTLGGGQVLDPAPPLHRSRDHAAAAAFLAGCAADPVACLRLRLERAGATGCELAPLARALGRRPGEVWAELEALAAAGRCALRRQPPAAFAAAFAPAAPPAVLAPAPAALSAALAAWCRAQGLAAPRREELLARFPQPEARAALAGLLRTGAVIECRPGWFLHRAAAAGLRTLLQGRRAAGTAAFSVSEFKQWTGLSRKHAIPLLEYCDLARWTRRRGEVREIAAGLDSAARFD